MIGDIALDRVCTIEKTYNSALVSYLIWLWALQCCYLHIIRWCMIQHVLDTLENIVASALNILPSACNIIHCQLPPQNSNFFTI